MSDLRDQLEASLRSPCVWPTKCIYMSAPEPPAEPVCSNIKCRHYATRCRFVADCSDKVVRRAA